jgi:hypothetical protein
MRKVIIFGFPHCGTTILRAILGNIDGVYGYKHELSYISDEMLEGNNVVVVKDPFMREYYFGNMYDDYLKIFIIRNPFYVFSSLNKRYITESNIPKNHKFKEWTNTVKKWLEVTDNPEKYHNFCCIKYEDLFENDYKVIRDIIDTIGIEYSDDIFENSDKDNRHGEFQIRFIRVQPANTNHDSYRTWQINQPFVNNNTPDKIDLTSEQIELISNDDYTKKLLYTIESI